MENLLQVNNLSVKIGGKEIIKDLNLNIELGKVYAIMGPNGCGKSSLACTIMGDPRYEVKSGEIKFMGKSLKNTDACARAKIGIFLAFQDPCEIEGATVFTVLKNLYMAKSKKLVTISRFSEVLFEKMDLLKIDREFAYRDLNCGFSGGQKKKLEILQMLLLEPKLVILDEIDSGLDIDALKDVSQAILKLKKDLPDIGILIITHYQRILKYIKPDFVHIMRDGKIIKSGDYALVNEIESCGYGGE